jgi:hypothetical protein
MKTHNYLFHMISLASIIIVSFSSCQSIQKIGPYSDNQNSVFLSITGVDNESIICTIENRNVNSIIIDWNRSSIAYNDNVTNILISEQNFQKAGITDIPPLRIPSGSKTTFHLVPFDNVIMKKTSWQSKKLILRKGSTVIISISATVDDKEGRKEGIITIKFPIEN